MELSAIVLIGGFGTRLRPITYSVPKPLVPIAGQPVLYHTLDLLPKEVTRVTLACGYKSEAFEAYLRAHPYRLPLQVVREETPLDTGGAMRNAAKGVSDPFVLLNGDVVSSLDMDEMWAFHRTHGGLGTMSLFDVEDPSPYGVAVLDAEQRIQRFVEKPPPGTAPSRWINAGAAIWSVSVLDAIAPGRRINFEREVLSGLLPRRVYGFPFRGWFEDAGTPQRFLNAQQLLFDHPRTGRFAPRANLPGARVIPPVATGRGCRGDGSEVGRYVTLGEGVRIAPGARVAESVLMDGVDVGEGAEVRRSLLGPGVKIPAGARVEDRCLNLVEHE